MERHVPRQGVKRHFKYCAADEQEACTDSVCLLVTSSPYLYFHPSSKYFSRASSPGAVRGAREPSWQEHAQPTPPGTESGRDRAQVREVREGLVEEARLTLKSEGQGGRNGQKGEIREDATTQARPPWPESLAGKTLTKEGGQGAGSRYETWAHPE